MRTCTKLLSLALTSVAMVACGAAPNDDGAVASTADLNAPARPAYLALGDSIAFGYNLNHREYFPDGSSKNLPDQAAHAVGYPEALQKILARDFHVRVPVANTSCPGEASGSLVTGKRADDNDCYENRHEFALHHEYDHQDDASGAGRSQLDHAVEYIAADPDHVKLVTITAGANDALRYSGEDCNWAQSIGDKACMAAGAVDAVLNKIQPSWEKMLDALANAGYRGPIVGVLYYSTSYRWTDFPTMMGIRLINAKIHDAVKAARQRHPGINIKLVEGFDIFDEASKPFGGDPCAAGLTMKMTKGPAAGTCDAHASNLGVEKLAEGVWRALSTSEQAALLTSGQSLASTP